jgi:hypothetical protein
MLIKSFPLEIFSSEDWDAGRQSQCSTPFVLPDFGMLPNTLGCEGIGLDWHQ